MAKNYKNTNNTNNMNKTAVRAMLTALLMATCRLRTVKMQSAQKTLPKTKTQTRRQTATPRTTAIIITAIIRNHSVWNQDFPAFKTKKAGKFCKKSRECGKKTLLTSRRTARKI